MGLSIGIENPLITVSKLMRIYLAIYVGTFVNGAFREDFGTLHTE